MRVRRGSTVVAGSRSRGVPARSRVVVRRSEAPMFRSAALAALGDGRAAVGRIEAELDALLAAVRDGTVGNAGKAADRLRGMTAAAAAAFASLAALK